MGAIVRLDLPKGLNADFHKWTWEAQSDYDKKEGKPEAEELVDFKPMSEVKGSYYQSTTALAASQLEDRDDYGISSQDNPKEGYTVYGVKKHKSIKTAVAEETAKDWHRTADFLKGYVQANVPEMLYNTKNNIVFGMINKGGYTAGDPIFDNNSADANVPSQTANLPYDGKPWFALSGNNHVAKNGSTYYNALAVTTASPSGRANGITTPNCQDMYIRFTATNAKKENGSNFNNTKDIIVVSSVAGGMDWDTVVNSDKTAENANNANNILKGKIKKIIGTNLITTDTMSVMMRRKGVKVFISEIQYEYWKQLEPDQYWFRVSFDYIAVEENWRFALANNAPTSAG